MARGCAMVWILLCVVGPACAPSGPGGGRADDEARGEVVDAKIETLMEQGHFPGVALAVMRNGKPVHVGTYGMARLADELPVTTRTVFELASLTKQMTALAVMTLVEEERLSLDARVVRWIDDAPAGWAEITVGQLLSQTAALAHHFERTIDGVYLLEYSRDEMLASVKRTPGAGRRA